ncbi:heat shock protein atpase subunit, partial [Nannochloropsis gaditana CCMP526]|uniref:heat shock protein atpase subunit n=1 Tax=Nannochloropsis gaditana (strain CCMP526) TaxID=1093141 RepID=UPI00029F6543
MLPRVFQRTRVSFTSAIPTPPRRVVGSCPLAASSQSVNREEVNTTTRKPYATSVSKEATRHAHAPVDDTATSTTSAGAAGVSGVCDDPGKSNSQLSSDSFPEDIVAHLDKYVIGQEEAKKATAIAMRMRWRRNQLPEDLRAEVTPSNILMKGPTGTGKTEIARRLSALAEAPFIKVEATRYTEVGFVGANTSDMIKGLLDNAVRLERELEKKNVAAEAHAKAETKVLDLLKLGNPKGLSSEQQQDLRSRLRGGEFDHYTVRVPPREPRSPSSPSSLHPLSDLLDGLDLGNINMGQG